MTYENPGYADHVVKKARKDAESKRNDWPGMPLTQIPLSFSDDLQRMVKAGRVEIVERSFGTRTYRYIVAL